MRSTLKVSVSFLLIGILFCLSCKKEYSCENCRETNKPPIANAGKDTIIVLPVNSVTLNGSASTSTDNNISDYAWSKISGPSTFTITNSNAIKTLAYNLVGGTYLFALTVIDSRGLSSKDTVQVVVNPFHLNQPPVTNAGADQTIVLPTNAITLNGSGSDDPEKNISGYMWSKISGPSLFNISNANAIQTPVINLTQGEYRFELKVTDSAGLSSKDTMSVYVVENSGGYEMIYNGGWGCNDLCRDGDVYWDSSPWNDHLYSDPNIPLAISILLDNSATWIDVHKADSPLRSINQFYWEIDRGYLWVFAYEGRLIGTKVIIKVKFL